VDRNCAIAAAWARVSPLFPAATARSTSAVNAAVASLMIRCAAAHSGGADAPGETAPGETAADLAGAAGRDGVPPHPVPSVTAAVSTAAAIR
jgi:hypothetical protein